MKGDKQYVTPNDQLLVEWGILIMIMAFVFYFLIANHIQNFVVKLAIIEITAVYEIMKLIGVYSDTLHQYLLEAKAVSSSGNFTTAAAIKIVSFSEKVTYWIYCIPIVLIMLQISKKGKLVKYNRVMDGNTLIEVMSKVYPRIKPIVHLDYGQGDKDRGAFTYNQRPFDWAVERGVIIDHKHSIKTRDTFDPIKCKQELIKDIESDIFRGVEPGQMDILRRFLFAVYGLWYLQEYDEHNNLLNEASEWFTYYPPNKRGSDGKMYDFKIPVTAVGFINRTAKRALSERRVRKIINQYVFQDTVLKAMMAGIPKTSVSHYIWLKAINKNLFYTMHQTGLEVSTMLVKGISDIFDKETELAIKGERLISVEEQEVLSKEEVLSKINFENMIRDVYFTLEGRGWLHQDEIIALSDGEIQRMLNTQKRVLNIDYQNPIHVYYQMNRTENQPFIKLLKFYDPKSQKVLGEIVMPNGMPQPDQLKKINFYVKNKYLMCLRKNVITEWMESRGIDISGAVFYDVMTDAKEAYPNHRINNVKDVMEATGVVNNSEFLPTEEFYYMIFSSIEKQLNERFQKFTPVSIENIAS